ncbi:MAG: tRNA (adenosine(37)-N6)-dimethylallyltransferase MiaA [Candidatus Latescibacterota bacterium]|jgi:tRNA dimethylallyltransferase|nr:MAG: tRNA (adenosine(37)-N6)-dimethylallyltransferase MiaA [Candidatus Latescibacterota bacterium]
MITALVILGPTACGKSAAAMHVAARCDGEIVSVDSRQAYRSLDIGTAKPGAEERRAVPHHLIDILDPSEKCDAASFARLAHEAIRAIAGRGSLPVLAGGSGLYVRAICDGLFDISLSPAARAAFAMSARDVSDEELRRRLAAADPESARRIHPNDRYRIVRALEVFELTGMPIGEHLKRSASAPDRAGVRFVRVGLELPRVELHRRIDARTAAMFERGWVGEVRALLEAGADPDWPGMKTLGYPQIVSHLLEDVPVEETAKRIRELTHQYAKRQITWFKKEIDVVWFRADEGTALERIVHIARGARRAKGD